MDGRINPPASPAAVGGKMAFTAATAEGESWQRHYPWLSGPGRHGIEPKPPTPPPTFEPVTDLDDGLPQAPIDSVKRKGKGLHKRTISAAIPSIKEVVAVDDSQRRNTRPGAPAQAKNNVVSDT